jgi:hypothetical protein
VAGSRLPHDTHESRSSGFSFSACGIRTVRMPSEIGIDALAVRSTWQAGAVGELPGPATQYLAALLFAQLADDRQLIGSVPRWPPQALQPVPGAFPSRPTCSRSRRRGPTIPRPAGAAQQRHLRVASIVSHVTPHRPATDRDSGCLRHEAMGGRRFAGLAR